MGVLLFLIGLFAMLEMNTLVVVCMMIDLFIYGTTMGTYTWVYIGQVAEEKSASLAIFTLWFFVFVLALTTDTLFNSLGNQGTFWLFSGLTFIGAILIMITHKETKGLTDEEIKLLYVPEKEKLKAESRMRRSKQIQTGISHSVGPEGGENSIQPLLSNSK